MRPRDTNPADVFTPRRVPTPEMFAERSEESLNGAPRVQDSLRDALLETGAQLLIYGETGVGKTSLLQYACREEAIDPLIEQCMPNMTFDQHIEMALADLINHREIDRSVDSGTEMTGGARVLAVRGDIRRKDGEVVHFESVHKPPLLTLADAMAQADRQVVVFDNFQNASGDEHGSWAHALEALADRASVKAILVGVADDAASLLGRSTSIRRRTVEVGVPRMTDQQVQSVLETGFHLLGLSLETALLQQFVFLADGFPFFAHLIGLNVARMARSTGQIKIDATTAAAGVQRVVAEAEASYGAQLGQASDSMHHFGGKLKSVRPRSRVVHYLAESPKRQWRHAEIVGECQRRSPALAAQPGSVVTTAIRDLAGDRGGNLLRRVQKKGDDVYQFSDPYLRTYLRLGTFARFGMTKRNWRPNALALGIEEGD